MCLKSPLVSVILPVYNGVNKINRAIDSVLRQSVDFELIVIDDGSNDNSVEVVGSYAKADKRIKLICLPINKGVSNARNKGIENSLGRYISFLDADDYWHDEKLSFQISQMEENNWKFTYTIYDRVTENGELINTVLPIRCVDYKKMLLNNYIATSTACIDSKIAKTLRFRDVGHEDYIFWLNSIQIIPNAYCIVSDFSLVKYVVSKNSLSSNKFRAILWQWRNYRDNLGLPLCKSIYYFVSYLLFAIYKRL